MKLIKCLFLISLCSHISIGQEKNIPDEFVYVKELIPFAITEIRYAGENNFIGEPIEGYHQPVAILSKPAAEALKKVQKDLENDYCLKIFDAYRPQRAVNTFMEWARDKNDTVMKQHFYPQIPKNQLFGRGYIATKSGHSRGSTVDLTLVDATTNEEVDMGGSYDFFGEISHYNNSKITLQQKKNRELLRKTMRKYGFVPYAKEWWHFTYHPEPFPNTYFDFVVE